MGKTNNNSSEHTGWKKKLHEIIFEADTSEGKLFDVSLLILILLSVAVVMLESVADFRENHGTLLKTSEWVLTILFSIEYILRIISVAKPTRYIFSFMGIIDLLSILPTYISLFIAGPQYLVIIRTMRLIRVFRVLKLTRYIGEAEVLTRALRESRYKIVVFLVAVLSIVMIMGTLMYSIEGPDNGFTSIPRAVYWAIVTLTTVGYGDISPQTALGQFLASIIMVLGYGVIAVPTGIVGAQLSKNDLKNTNSTQACPHCMEEGHHTEAQYCYKCGEHL